MVNKYNLINMRDAKFSTILAMMVTFKIKKVIVLILVPIVMLKSETIGTMSVTMEKF